jgi:hypothetical protein
MGYCHLPELSPTGAHGEDAKTYNETLTEIVARMENAQPTEEQAARTL